ncbi:hypothetical protein ABEB36_009370 [Hypothenemus hampei]|uniref:Uncharacterized protein n=1 Tax=Hypothenemus hampei TaxID=57062 RepID=A0ABD1EGS3_HYPHA
MRYCVKQYCFLGKKNIVYYLYCIQMFCQMYKVIFVEDWCAVAPLSWINETEKTCVWPPKKNTSKAVLHNLPPQQSWTIMKIKYCLEPFETYQQAKEAERSAANLSLDEVESGLTHTQDLPARRVRKPKIFLSSEENGYKIIRKNVLKIPDPPANILNVEDWIEKNVGSSSDEDSYVENQQRIISTTKKNETVKKKFHSLVKTVNELTDDRNNNYYNKHSHIDFALFNNESVADMNIGHVAVPTDTLQNINTYLTYLRWYFWSTKCNGFKNK